jgi:hypothetical protein
MCSITLLVSLQPILLPRQPRLPQLAADVPLPSGWHLLATGANGSVSTPSPRRYRPLFSAMAVGESTSLQGPDGAQVSLTPLASWSAGVLNPASFDGTCLTARGTLEAESDEITRKPMLDGQQPPSLPQRLLLTVMPAGDRSFSCLMVSSNRADLLASGHPLWPALSRAVRWPPHPSF